MIPKALERIDFPAAKAAGVAAERELEKLEQAAEDADKAAAKARAAFEASPSNEAFTASEVAKQVAANAHKRLETRRAELEETLATWGTAKAAEAFDASAAELQGASREILDGVAEILRLEEQVRATVAVIAGAVDKHSSIPAEAIAHAARLDSLKITSERAASWLPSVNVGRVREQVEFELKRIYGLDGESVHRWLSLGSNAMRGEPGLASLSQYASER